MSWLEGEQREQLNGLADPTTRIVEDLGALRERTAVIEDGLQSLLSDRPNTRLALIPAAS